MQNIQAVGLAILDYLISAKVNVFWFVKLARLMVCLASTSNNHALNLLSTSVISYIIFVLNNSVVQGNDQTINSKAITLAEQKHHEVESVKTVL